MKRREVLDKWRARREQLSDAEARVKHRLLPYQRHALGNLQLLLLDEILRETSFKDTELISDLKEGLRLTRWMRDTGLFAKFVRPPELDVHSLLYQSKDLSPLTFEKLSKSTSDDLSAKAWEETKLEEEKQWIWRDDSCAIQDVVLARRFGLRQKNKVRVIDDGKECGLNLARGLPEKFTLQGVDFVAAVILEASKTAGGSRLDLRGKTFDLVSACKHYPLHPEDRSLLRVGVWDTDSERVRIYGFNVLPFGATGSVAGFLRVANALWSVGCHALGIPWCNFFDDFPTLASAEETVDIASSVLEMFSLLGVEVATEGKKATQFSQVFAALGLEFDLTEICESGSFIVRHTSARREELNDTLADVLSSKTLRRKEAETLRGRLRWYNSYLFGRAPCRAMSVLSSWASGHSRGFIAELESALRVLQTHVNTARPLHIPLTSLRTFYLFTDGSYEPGSSAPACIGGILYDSTIVKARLCASSQARLSIEFWPASL